MFYLPVTDFKQTMAERYQPKSTAVYKAQQSVLHIKNAVLIIMTLIGFYDNGARKYNIGRKSTDVIQWQS